MRTYKGAAVLAAWLTLVGAVSAQTPTAPEALVTTHGQVVVAAHTLRYTAQTGLLPIFDNDTGGLVARVFIVAYTLDRAARDPKRPLTFIWNGGPGSSASEVHLLGLGPRGLREPETYPEWPAAPPHDIVDRAETWLAVSDLVFIDPVGTGYSRATSDAYRDVLYTTRGDVEAVAEVIRIYVTRNNAWDAPLFLAGESYGTERAMGVAEALEKRRRHVAGVVLMSGFFNTGQTVPQSLSTALEVPAYTAAAYYHHRLAAELQALPRAEVLKRATEWARNSYAPALEHPTELATEQRSAILAALKSFTAVDSSYVDAKSLVLAGQAFADHLIPGHALGRYDTRMIGAMRAPDNPIWVPTTDASIMPVLDVMQGTSPDVIRYLRDTLGFKDDLLYAGPFGEAFHPGPLTAIAPQIWGPYSDWMTFKWNHGEEPPGHHSAQQGAAEKAGSPPPENAVAPPFKAPPPLRHAMDLDPGLLVMNVTGLYDGYIDSCAKTEESVARTDPAIRVRVRAFCYDAGHMTYTDAAVRRALERDFGQFVRDATAAATKTSRH